MSCLCHYGPALLRFWFQTYLGNENSASYLKTQAEKTFCYHGHALVTLYVQFLCSDWSKFDRWVHAENLCSILKLVYFWQLKLTEFCLNLWCFFYVILHWMYKMKYSCYQESSVIHGWFVYWVFGWEMQHLETCLLWQLKLTEFFVNLWCFLLSFPTGCTKWNTAAIKSLLLFMAGLFTEFLVEKCAACPNPISDDIVFIFHLAGCGLKSPSSGFQELHLEW